MEVERTYCVKLNERDAISLKKVLGRLNDDKFAEFGVKGEARAAMSDLWDLLPDEPED